MDVKLGRKAAHATKMHIRGKEWDHINFGVTKFLGTIQCRELCAGVSDEVITLIPLSGINLLSEGLEQYQVITGNKVC